MTWLMPIDATRPQPSAMKIRISDFMRIEVSPQARCRPRFRVRVYYRLFPKFRGA